jgi:hypothetical protein
VGFVAVVINIVIRPLVLLDCGMIAGRPTTHQDDGADDAGK